MAEDIDKLLTRADAAIAEAKRLIGVNEEWQQRISDRLFRMFSRFSGFRASDRKTRYPQDFKEQRPPYQPFPSSEDEPL